MNIALTGFMGCGKTSVGKALSSLLPEYSLIDLDEYIESMTGRRIPDIFKEDGEPAFRNLEAQALANIFTHAESATAADERRRKIISLGGGAITTEPCRKLLKEYAICFYLQAAIDTLATNLLDDSACRTADALIPRDRPLLNPEGGSMSKEMLRKRIQQLMTARAPLYESAADYIIPTDGLTPDQVAAHIISLLRI